MELPHPSLHCGHDGYLPVTEAGNFPGSKDLNKLGSWVPRILNEKICKLFALGAVNRFPFGSDGVGIEQGVKDFDCL